MIVGTHLGMVRASGSAADVWCAWVHASEHDVAGLAATVLSDAERTRLARYAVADAAARYVITRSLVRQVLGASLGVAPGEVDIRLTDLGKPVISGPLHFNVSHSGGIVMLAVSGDRAVGIDVERRREVRRAGALINRWLTPEERGSVTALRTSGLGESDAFLKVWSAKEARLKALGVGISAAITADVSRVVAVELDDLLAHATPEPDGYVGAVAFA